MGSFRNAIEPVAVTKPAKAVMHRPRSRSRASLFVFAFTAASAFVLVNVVDPYSGATASPYFQVVGERFGGEAQQTVFVASGHTNTITRDSFTFTAAPPPPPPVPVAAAKTFTAPSAAIPDPGSAQAYAAGAVASRGWDDEQYNCLVSLWSRESGWRVNAMNSSSGAYGIPQALPGSKMASAGADWETNAATQVEWGLGYISGRYGSPCGAWAHSEDAGWY